MKNSISSSGTPPTDKTSVFSEEVCGGGGGGSNGRG